MTRPSTIAIDQPGDGSTIAMSAIAVRVKHPLTSVTWFGVRPRM